MPATHTLRPGVIVRGPTLPEPVEVLAIQPFGESLKVIGRGLNTGQTYDPVLSPSQLAQLTVSSDRAPFDGDARMFRLGIEALRLGLAYEYDPFFSLSIARVDPLRRKKRRTSGAKCGAAGARRESQRFARIDGKPRCGNGLCNVGRNAAKRRRL
jgi:hypothetical protein